MTATDTSEKGLETLIVAALTGREPESEPTGEEIRLRPLPYGGAGYLEGDPRDYDREHAVDVAKLLAFLNVTQSKVVEVLGLAEDGPRRQQFLHRLQGEIAKRGVIDVFRNGVKHGPASVDLFYGTPTPGNAKAEQLFRANMFSVTRQLRYSKGETQLALDLVIFVNGLPIATFELKNRLTKQTVEDAVQQYKRDRDPKELLFQFGRCVVHFAVDDHEVRMCAHLKGKGSWFLPFNKGWNDGAGNPPNPNGIKTDYLWKEILTKPGLTDILENYAQVVEEKDERGYKKPRQIFPRYHQLDVVRKLLADAKVRGVGRRYLIQHSAGSGKSNSIAWLAHQLIGLERDSAPLFDSVIVVTDRRVLDKQIKDTIKQFAQVAATVGHAEHSGDLRRFLASGKKIIITTVQKFPVILDEIGDEHRGREFAILIDEAHSSQGGRTAAQMNIALAEQGGEGEDETVEDVINRILESRRMLGNASYFAFTATPKNKTLEIFGKPYPEGGQTKHRPFHSYTMKQAIQEGFILDVLKHYTPVQSYYRLMKTAELEALPLVIGADGVRVPFRPHPRTAKGKTRWREIKVAILARLGARLSRQGTRVTRLCQRRLVAVLGTIDDLAPRLWLEAVRQGVRTAVQVVWLSDGGRGLWSVFQRLFQAVGAVAILDFYQAAQNLYKGASAWLEGRTRACQQWFADLRHRLRHGHEQHVLAELAALVEATSLPESARQTLTNVYTYLKTHEDHIRYDHFKAAGLPIGSGLVESACKWLIQQRFKGVGMRWSEAGFNHLLHLRLAWVNQRFDSFFPDRVPSPN